MIGTPQPEHEAARLLDLAHLGVLDTPPEPHFDRITRLAAHLLRAPVAALNFIDEGRQWSKSAVGMAAVELPRAASVCAWPILGDAPFVVPDAPADPRFATSPLVTGSPRVRSYAGVPLRTSAGHAIGTLCVADDHPHAWGEPDLTALVDLAALVVTDLEGRVHRRALERELGAHAHETRHLRAHLAHVQVLEAVQHLLDLPLTPEEVTRQAAALMGEALEADWTGLVTFRGEALEVQAAHHRPGLEPAVLERGRQVAPRPGSLTHGLAGLTAPLYLDDYARHPQAVPELVRLGLRAVA
ncbi:GAF domain-containing protein [Deinococcus aestuarii]|uniref:GAF domain-containing protein n=1 Tax=Deinococcus aestuarii TaxID=2774531 RepID=UPI001C0C4D9E|nr:GAF domain-containing protein [Deinococcus aestuarii]